MDVAGVIIVLGILLGLVVIVAFWLLVAYNGLVGKRNLAHNAWAQIDVQLKRRHDLIPNLVETAKGYVKHERETLENVTKARGAAASARTPGEASQAEGLLSSALGRLFAVVENYPDLKANQNFILLQEELTSTENRIGFARQAYNDEVTGYNTRLQTVPTNLVAGLFGFTAMDLFELAAPVEREAPKVAF